MNITTTAGTLAEQQADALLLGVSTDNQLDDAGSQLDQALDGQLGTALASVGFTGKRGEVCTLPSFGRIPAARIVVTGLGEPSSVTVDIIRSAWGEAARAARKAGARTIASAAPSSAFGSAAIRAAVEGIELGLYRHTAYRSDANDQTDVESVSFVGVDDTEAIAAGRKLARGVSMARNLVNAPGMDLYPERLAGRAWEMADELGMECTVYDRAALEEMGAGAIVAVGRGSQREPRLIHLVYRPEGESLGVAGLVGKAITFDTGGVNLKPADGMRNMKMDMAGGAAVIGAMGAIAEMKPPYTVHGVIAAAENMPSHSAYRPGDVLRTLSGKTVEITNTDAEGRLVLADALTFTARQGAEFMIDLATLTGASVVAVGNGAASLFGTDEGLVQDVLQAAEFSGERMWHMPLWDAYRADLNSDIADIVNSGNRDGGAIKAALFLREFSHDIPWVHLDIAGPAWSTREEGYRIKCGTGYGTHTLVTLLEQRAGRH
ncbi:MAG: leucyl aminopeptidase [Sphaerobacteraceae bacterium]|nr:MAG: leucyl aminopeptidase [Sphaerobacteraceae bacterium]